MRPSSFRVVAAAVVVVALHSVSAWADATTETRLREALRAATAQVQTLEDERAKCQAKQAALEKELEALRKQPIAQPAAKVNCGNTSALSRQVAEQTAAAAKLKESLAKCQAQNTAEDAAKSAASADEVKRLSTEVAALNKRLEASEARNARMFQVGMQVVDWASNLKVTDLGDAFVGDKRVELENMAQDFHDKLLDQKAMP